MDEGVRYIPMMRNDTPARTRHTASSRPNGPAAFCQHASQQKFLIYLRTSADEYVYLPTRLPSFNSIGRSIATRLPVLRFQLLARCAVIDLRPARQLLDPHSRTHARCCSQILLRGSVVRFRPIDVSIVLLVCPCRLCTGCQRLLETVGPSKGRWVSCHCDFRERKLWLWEW